MYVYSTILVTIPVPTVRPPSRMLNRRPASIGTGVISSTSSVVLSPGITISVPSLSFKSPVMSAVPEVVRSETTAVMRNS
ncbi:hypothetical protein THAOC_31924 [Thalassiosira oceanica]|uniref:Uncharacterized protein n=1 Tax=Thalassiosira oceanica TaxID=159749 RepID=K0RRH8_THAOC|nr:hypothetical protein THAOC_31924 [Thalassiosira oceanica]|eukprot:EJK49222.1 hypothetical protein THAOC_31924 [Thalassiosira oceanica]